MTQLKCPECGKEFDDTKQACPDCGCPAKECSVVEPIKQATEKEESPNKQTENNFSRSSLLSGENIIATAKWQITPIVVILIIVAIVCWIIFGVEVSSYYTEELAWSTFFPLALISTILIIIVSVTIKFQEFVITNKRVIAYYGFIRRVAFEVKIEQVESIAIYQGLFGRLFGFGTVQVCGIGASKAAVRFVENPFEFRQHFFDLQYAEKQITLD